jgi:hypothetical protein
MNKTNDKPLTSTDVYNHQLQFFFIQVIIRIISNKSSFAQMSLANNFAELSLLTPTE